MEADRGRLGKGEFRSSYAKSAVELLVCKHRNEIRQIPEKRPEYCVVYQFYYGIVIVIEGIDVFIESVFEPASGNDPDMIRVVSVHPPTE